MNSSAFEPPSTSAAWRLKGNQVFRQVTDGLPRSIKERRLLEAINFYYRAVETAECDTDISSASKNYAVSSVKLGALYTSTKTTDKAVFYYKECLKYFHKALRHGMVCQTEGWTDQVRSSVNTASLACVSYLMSETNGLLRIQHLEGLVAPEYIDDCRVVVFKELADNYFHLSVTLLGDKEYKRALYYLRECYRPIEEMKKSPSVEIKAEAHVLEEDVRLQTCIAESMQARCAGEELVRQALEDNEELPSNLLWEAADRFKEAYLLAKGIEMEQEAIALSHIGLLYHKLLRILSYRAIDYLKMSLQLAEALHPMNFDDQEWYQKAEALVTEHQRRMNERQELADQRQRTKVAVQESDEMKKLEEIMKKGDDAKFLEFLYKTHKPLNKKHCLKQNHGSNLKKAFRDAVIHYHPDRVDVDIHGLEVHIFHQELEKLLTQRYEYFKGE